MVQWLLPNYTDTMRCIDVDVKTDVAKMEFVQQLKFDERGLIPVVVQDVKSGEVLTLAYMNREAVIRTLETGKAWYWRRSHQKLMMKGETSGRVQIVHEMRIDCDADALLIRVEQIGGAGCHEGYRSCFYRRVTEDGKLEVDTPRIFDPSEVYR